MIGINLRKLHLDIDSWLKEDLGDGDITTYLTIDPEQLGTATFLAKEDGILCGVEVATEVFKALDQNLQVKFTANDGDGLEKGQSFGTLSGSLCKILEGERVALNLLRHLSGVSTATRSFVDTVAPGSKTKILDTRKTTPGLRYLEKYAVRVGGGFNHRHGLYDAILIKDNHIKSAGGVSNAAVLAMSGAPHYMKIEVEVSNEEELKEALDSNVPVVLLDNMSNEEIEVAMAMIDGRAVVEVSGTVTLDRVRSLSSLGVDYISVGALTHSVKALDLSLKISNLESNNKTRKLGL